MLKTGLTIAVLLLVSGCSTLMGPPAEPVQQNSMEQAENARLQAESAALRQALKEKKAELEALKAASE